jgi:hypothetical protein
VPSLADDVLEPPSSTALLLSYYQIPKKGYGPKRKPKKKANQLADVAKICHRVATFGLR